MTLVGADALALTAGLFATYWFRFRSGLLPVPFGIPSVDYYVVSLAVVIPVGLVVIRSAGLYRPHRRAAFLRDFVDGARAMALTCVLLAAIAFFYREFSFSRTLLVGFGIGSSLFFVALRRLAGLGHRVLRGHGIGIQRVGIVGGGEMAAGLAHKIESRPGTGLEVVATLEGPEWSDEEGPSADRARRPGRMRSFARAHRLDRVIVTDPDLSHDERLDLVEECHGDGIRCDFVPDLFEVMLGRIRVEEIDGVPLVGSRLYPLDRFDRLKKRTLDLVLSSVALVVLSPLLGLIVIAIRMGSKGPVFFRQPRLGRDGREFEIIKFRSMRVEAEEATGPVWAHRGDDRTTRVGQILRRSSFDELPQLWNVLKGEMSLVGPRPERRFFVDRFRRRIPRYLERHGVKSGLTGWAQVNGLRGDTSIEERTRFDIWYVENWSLELDVKILLLTCFRFLFQEDAY
jgi:exopolysaccharide biosynthesis polyprenyl glycosylphosphotransferase